MSKDSPSHRTEPAACSPHATALPENNSANDDFVTTEQSAADLKLSPKTLEGWRVRGDGPPYFKFGRSVRYRRSLNAAWAAERQRKSTA